MTRFKNVTYTHNKILFHPKEHPGICDKWMNLEDSMVGELSQTQIRDTAFMMI